MLLVTQALLDALVVRKFLGPAAQQLPQLR
jgi:hypothetical protein